MTDEPTTFWNARIRIWTPLDPRDPCLAKIGNESPLLFSGPTPIAVKRKAEEFRAAEKERQLAKKVATNTRKRQEIKR